ncbi:MAG: hypothetical protein ABIR67_01885 [Gaiellaceae bacterium]
MVSPRHAVRLLLPLLVAAVAASSSAPAAPARSRTCADGYTYAGRLSATRAHGVQATLTALSKPEVADGHVAAWVGVGGVGEGPNGSDAWLQVGLSALPDSESSLYYEVTRPGAAPTYVELKTGIRTGDRFRVAVLELAKRPHHWRVWLNGKPVSAPVELRGSSGRWRPIATAESWAGAGAACNRFNYRFEGVRIAAANGGSWRSFVGGHTFLDSGYRLVDRGASTFVATSG